MRTFVLGRFYSLGYAFKGLKQLITTENAIMVQSLVLSAFTILGAYIGITRMEWIVQLFISALILGAEGLNTAIEKLCDFIHPDHSDKIGFIKDIAAGAVAFVVLFGLVIAILIYYPYISALL